MQGNRKLACQHVGRCAGSSEATPGETRLRDNDVGVLARVANIVSDTSYLSDTLATDTAYVKSTLRHIVNDLESMDDGFLRDKPRITMPKYVDTDVVREAIES